MASKLIGVVDDAHGNMVSIDADGPHVVIGFASEDWRVFEPGQIAELIGHLEAARDEALLNEAGTPGETETNCLTCWHLRTLHVPGGCTAKVYPFFSLTGEPCPCEGLDADDE